MATATGLSAGPPCPPFPAWGPLPLWELDPCCSTRGPPRSWGLGLGLGHSHFCFLDSPTVGNSTGASGSHLMATGTATGSQPSSGQWVTSSRPFPPRQLASQQEPADPGFRPHPPAPPSPGKEETCGSASVRLRQTTGSLLDAHSTPRPVTHSYTQERLNRYYGYVGSCMSNIRLASL